MATTPKTPTAEELLSASAALEVIDTHALAINNHYISDMAHHVADFLGLTHTEGYWFRPSGYDHDPTQH